VPAQQMMRRAAAREMVIMIELCTAVVTEGFETKNERTRQPDRFAFQDVGVLNSKRNRRIGCSSIIGKFACPLTSAHALRKCLLRNFLQAVNGNGSSWSGFTNMLDSGDRRAIASSGIEMDGSPSSRHLGNFAPVTSATGGARG
jgi:hypothetical protein